MKSGDGERRKSGSNLPCFPRASRSPRGQRSRLWQPGPPLLRLRRPLQLQLLQLLLPRQLAAQLLPPPTAAVRLGLFAPAPLVSPPLQPRPAPPESKRAEPCC